MSIKLIEAINASLHQFRRYPLRTALTLVGMIIGVASLIAMNGIGEGTKRKVIDDMERLGGTGLIVVQDDHPNDQFDDGRKPSPRLSWQDFNAFQQSSSLVVAAVPVSSIPAEYWYQGRRARGPCIGVSPDFFRIRDWAVKVGRAIHELDIRDQKRVCVLGSEIAKELGVGEEIVGKKLRIASTEDFTVTGIMFEHQIEGAQWMNSQVFVPITTHQTRLSGNRHLNRIILRAKDTALVPALVGEVARILKAHHGSVDRFDIYSQTQVINTVHKSTKLLRFSFGTIASIVLTIGGIGIMNLMLVTVSERTREIGVRKAVGARDVDIFLQLLLEAVIITIIGGVFGILIGIEGGNVFAVVVSGYIGNPVHSIVTYRTIVLSAASIIAVGLVFGVYPAVRAARMDPSKALIHE